MWKTLPGKVFDWRKQERPAPIVATTNKEGTWLIQADKVVGEATRQRSELWTGAPGEDVMQAAKDVANMTTLDPLQPEELWDIIRRIPIGKA
eukprot:1631425-Heterocapsa_arctica.AAC.1